MNSITKRWIRGSLLIIIALLVIVESILIISLKNSYYLAAENALINRLNSINATLEASGKMISTEKERLLFNITSEFGEKDKFELMLIDSAGLVVATSSGFRPSDNQHIDDFNLAINSNEDFYIETYSSQIREKIMSATYLLDEPTEDIYAVRIITSLTRVEEEINIIMGFSLLAVVAVIAFSMISGSFFVRSIVSPIHMIKETAYKISKGEFDARIPNNKKYDQEIGELCNTINNMAQELGRNDELKNEFISSISHELRTPLTAIKGWAETMSTTDNVQTLQKGTQIILGETDRLSAMVENLLDFSRLQNATLSLTKEKLDLVAEVYEAVIMYAPQAEKKNVKINFEEPDIFIPVIADKSRIKQVMINLLDNALKYSYPNSDIDINIFNNRQNGTVTVEVKDYGKGIHPDDIEKVKQKFYKGKGAKQGSGIGLALVNEIIKQHGGTFDVESEYTKYTKMSFTLKVVRTMKGK